MPLFSPTILNILGFKVNSADRNSSINFGPSCHIDVNNFTKSNTSGSSSSGDFVFQPQGPTAVFDPDVIDSQGPKASIV